MSGFVYKWTNTINGKWYIGSRKGTPDDGYRHTSKIMTLAEEKYGVQNFSREILYEGEKYRNIEAQMLSEIDAANNPMSYNRCNIVGARPLSNLSAEKQKESQLKRWENIRLDPAHYNNIIRNMREGANNRKYEPLKGKTYDEIYGIEKSQELRNMRAEQQKSHSVVKGKTWEELYGIKRATEMKEAARQRMISNNPKHKKNIS